MFNQSFNLYERIFCSDFRFSITYFFHCMMSNSISIGTSHRYNVIYFDIFTSFKYCLALSKSVLIKRTYQIHGASLSKSACQRLVTIYNFPFYIINKTKKFITILERKENN